MQSDQLKFETIKEIGNGLHATIYLAKKIELVNGVENDSELICVKVFKPYTDYESKNCAEVEYKVSQILKNHPNIIRIDSFER